VKYYKPKNTIEWGEKAEEHEEEEEKHEEEQEEEERYRLG